jgi:uncharacterized protein (TIGR02145 family)
MSDDPIGFTLTNDATKSATLYVGVAATLTMTLVNNSGAPIALSVDAGAPATLTLYMPRDVFNGNQFGQLSVTATGWQPAYDAGALTITLTCTAAGTWAEQAPLTFSIANALTSGPPTSAARATVLPDNLEGNVPPQVDTPLNVQLPPNPGNLKLPDVLQASLDNQGLIYTSDAADTLINKLFLTLKNIGPTPIATDQTLPGSPTVLVSFVYGNTSGALADDTIVDNPPQPRVIGPAWSVTAGISSQPTQAQWTPSGQPLKGQPHPQWQLSPSLGNTQILGSVTSDQANVTFVFDQIVSATPPGHTQMFVLCTGFAKDSQTKYDDHLYVLDINKQAPPPTLGVLAFSASRPVITVNDPHKQVGIPVSWTVFGAGSVNLLTSSPAVGVISHAYPNGPLLAYGTDTVKIDPPPTSQAFFMTLQALDGAGGYLNGAQYTAYLDLSYVQDPDGTVYPVGLFGDRYWMLADYAYRTSSGSFLPYPSGSRLYLASAAAQAMPPGWSLPTLDDWQALVAVYPSNSYAALIAGGSSGFNANLTGLRMADGSYANAGQAGYYWVNSNTQPLTQFSPSRQAVLVGVAISGQVALAVRYVRHA